MGHCMASRALVSLQTYLISNQSWDISTNSFSTFWTTYAAANELRWVRRRCEYLFQTLTHLCQNRNSIFRARYRRHAETQWNCPSQPACQANQSALANSCPMYRHHHNCRTNKKDSNQKHSIESESLSLPQWSQFVVIGSVCQVAIVCMLEHLPHFLPEMAFIR